MAVDCVLVSILASEWIGCGCGCFALICDDEIIAQG